MDESSIYINMYKDLKIILYNKLYNMKAFVINLERRKDRLDNIHKNYVKPNIYDLEIIKACDGKIKENNSEEMNNFINFFINTIKNNNSKINNNYKYYSYDHYKSGEMGCFVSHLYLWKKIIDNNIENCIIFEDDITNFDNDFDNKILAIKKELPNNYNILWLNVDSQENDIKISENIYIKKNNIEPGTYGYIISLNGANILYNNFINKFKGKLGVDHYILLTFKIENLDQHISNPKLIFTTQNNEDFTKTDIQDDPTLIII